MTPYIEAKKAEIVQDFERFLSTDPEWQGSSRTISLLLGEYLELDTLLDEIESRVVPAEYERRSMEDRDEANEREGWNMCRNSTRDAFQHLRTGETNQ